MIQNLSPPEGRKRRDSKGANAAAAQWAKSGEESPMRQGVFENTDFKNDYAELRNNVPLAQVWARAAPSVTPASPFLPIDFIPSIRV